MADFFKAYSITFKNEAGYAGNLGDGGGETYCGITRNYHPEWEGWKYVDAYKKKYGTPKRYRIIPGYALANLVKQFYKGEFWDKVIQGDMIQTQDIANFCFDWTFNGGIAVCARISMAVASVAPANMTLKASKTKLTPPIIEITNQTPEQAYSALWMARKEHIEELKRIPEKRKFYNEWLNRLNAFPRQIKTYTDDLFSQWFGWLFHW